MTSKYSGSDYSCGDLCLDINGCPKCETKLKMPLENFRDYKDYIVFISCTLEYVNNLPLIAKRLLTYKLAISKLHNRRATQ